MICPYCGHNKDKVIDSRESKGGEAIRRRRQCLACSKRFTTYERTEEVPYMVIKKDGRREPFDRQKILRGLLKACEKRPISVSTLEDLIDIMEQKLQEKPEKEIPTSEIGSYLMERLRELDKVAYVRFASVYREFKDINEFVEELKALLEK